MLAFCWAVLALLWWPSSLNSIQEILLVLPCMNQLQFDRHQTLPPDSEESFGKAAALLKGQAEGSVRQPRGRKPGYFPEAVVPECVWGFFFQMYTFTVWRFAERSGARLVFTKAMPRGGTHALPSVPPCT